MGRDNQTCTVPLTHLDWTGKDLRRPECVVAHQSGVLIAPDWTGRGGVSLISSGGRTIRHLVKAPPFDLKPNGIALEKGGSILIAHLGDEIGGVYRLHVDGGVEPVLVDLDGVPMPPTNFVHSDRDGTLWITVSTRKTPRALGYRPDIDDGFIVRLSKGEARIVADGLGYTNECIVHPTLGELWVNETFGRKLSAFSIMGDRLGQKRVVATFGPGDFPDGLSFDVEGHAWVTSIVSNRVYRVAPEGTKDLILGDADHDHLTKVEEAFQAGVMDRPHLDRAYSQALKNTSNLAFGGGDLKTAYLGCLLGDRIASFQCPVAGAPLPSWDVDITPLLEKFNLMPEQGDL